MISEVKLEELIAQNSQDCETITQDIKMQEEQRRMLTQQSLLLRSVYDFVKANGEAESRETAKECDEQTQKVFLIVLGDDTSR